LLLGVLGSASPLLAGMLAACAHGNPTTSLADLGNGEPGDASDTYTPKGYLRFADWAPDAIDGFDVCLAPHSSASAYVPSPSAGGEGGSGDDEGGVVEETGPWSGPLLGGKFAFPNVSAYVSVPVGAYDLGAVVPEKGCASVVPVLALPPIAEGAHVTVALVGDLAPLGMDQKARLVAFVDDDAGPQTQAAAIRFIDALPGGSAVVFGTGSVGARNFAPLTGNVPFGSDTSMPANATATDSNGYDLLAPAANVTLSAHSADFSATGAPDGLLDAGFGNVGGGGGGGPGVFGAGGDLATGSNVSWQAGVLGTVALVDGDYGFKPELLVCNDSAPAQVSSSLALTPCVVVAP
jgi:hypothetical protein